MNEGYLQTAKSTYREAALEPQEGLCCTTTPVWKLPGLRIPEQMLEMNYGCGSTVHPRDLADSPSVVYVGVGGGMELLQFAYFSRRPGAILGVDPVSEMLASCRANLRRARDANPWFQESFVELREGDALSLPVADSSLDVAAQNCLFNIFRPKELRIALAEIYRVLRPGGRVVLSDPICEAGIPQSLQNDEKLRALCLSGAIPLQDYVRMITDCGFGTVEIRARRPYRVLDPQHYAVETLILVESVEICAIKDPVPDDGPCVFTGRTAIYFGPEEEFDDGKGHRLRHNQPMPVCEKTAGALQALGRSDLLITQPTYFYDGGGCC